VDPPLRDRKKNTEGQKRNNNPPRGEPSEGNPCTLPTQQQDKEVGKKTSRGVVVGGGLFGVVGSSSHEGVPGVGVAEMVDVCIKNDLVRDVVALKDGCESVVLRVEALVAPVGDDRSSRGRESATRAAGAARGVRAGGRTRARRPRCLATCVTAAKAAVVTNRRVACVGARECTWGVRTREPDDLVLHLVEREGVTVVDVGEKLFVCLLVAGGFGEVKAHESDEGVDVLDGHGLHLAGLRGRGLTEAM